MEDGVVLVETRGIRRKLNEILGWRGRWFLRVKAKKMFYCLWSITPKLVAEKPGNYGFIDLTFIWFGKDIVVTVSGYNKRVVH